MKKPSEQIKEIQDNFLEINKQLDLPEHEEAVLIAAIIKFLDEKFQLEEDKPIIAANSTWTYKMGWNDCLKKIEVEVNKFIEGCGEESLPGRIFEELKK